MFEMIKKNWIPITITISIIVFIFIVNQDMFGFSDTELTPIEANIEGEQGIILPENTSVIVDVKGEVVQPGIYEVDIDSRIHDVIILAGGFLEEADQTSVNLAQKVQDEMMIVVPKVGESAIDGSGTSSGKVRINYASQAEIETLPGIGPSKAQAIIQYRDENGFFKSVEDLLQISGIGEKTLENMKENIQVP